MSNFSVFLIPLAKQDLRIARDYYRDIRPALAREFLQRIKEAQEFIVANPLAVDIVYEDVRMHLIRQFPYHIHFVVEARKNGIVVIAVEYAGRGDLDFSHRI